MKVSSRARRHEDRAGDPLDGLVNMFDLGIVLAVAFLLAALSSVNLTELVTSEEASEQARAAQQAPSEAAQAPEDAVTAQESETVREIELEPGERVVGRGEEVGRVFRLADGSTVIVRPGEGGGGPAEGAQAP